MSVLFLLSERERQRERPRETNCYLICISGVRLQPACVDIVTRVTGDLSQPGSLLWPLGMTDSPVRLDCWNMKHLTDPQRSHSSWTRSCQILSVSTSACPHSPALPPRIRSLFYFPEYYFPNYKQGLSGLETFNVDICHCLFLLAPMGQSQPASPSHGNCFYFQSADRSGVLVVPFVIFLSLSCEHKSFVPSQH